MRPHIIGGNWKLQINSISEVKIRLTQILNDLQKKNINLSKIFHKNSLKLLCLHSDYSKIPLPD